MSIYDSDILLALDYVSAQPETKVVQRDFLSRFSSDLLDHLLDAGLLSMPLRDQNPASLIHITTAGQRRLFEIRQRANDKAAEKEDQNRKEKLQEESSRKDARRSWVQWAITTIISLSSFFAGAIVEKLTGFMEWIATLFH